MRRRLGFALRAVCFLLIVVCVWVYATYVLTPKSDYGICPILTYYQQPEETVDVLTIGTSLAYAGINTNVLWKEYGIAAYNLCTAEQPFWISYYYLIEALRYQQPALIIIDAKSAMYNKDYSNRGRTILSTYGIVNPDSRVGAILASLAPSEDRVSYLLGLPEIHDKYKDVKEKDFIFPPDNGRRGPSWKGYIEADFTEAHVLPSVAYTSEVKRMNSREEEYVRRLMDLAKERELNLLFVAFPNPDYAYDHPYYNHLWQIVNEYGFPYINYNDYASMLGLDYGSDFGDWQHLNVHGSVIFSELLGQNIRHYADLPDRRGDPRWESWQTCADAWYERYSQYSYR